MIGLSNFLIEFKGEVFVAVERLRGQTRGEAVGNHRAKP